MFLETLSNCIISSLQAPQGVPTLPLDITHTIFSIFDSPLVSILKIAFRSAHIPSVLAVSKHIPVYILPFLVSIAAATWPPSIKGEITLLF